MTPEPEVIATEMILVFEWQGKPYQYVVPVPETEPGLDAEGDKTVNDGSATVIQ